MVAFFLASVSYIEEVARYIFMGRERSGCRDEHALRKIEKGEKARRDLVFSERLERFFSERHIFFFPRKTVPRNLSVLPRKNDGR